MVIAFVPDRIAFDAFVHLALLPPPPVKAVR
jgi:hypothetical protein